MTAVPDEEPFWSGRRLSAIYPIAAGGAFALIGLRPVWVAAPMYIDVAFRLVCLVGAIFSAWSMYQAPKQSRPWLSDRQIERIAKMLELVSVAVSVAVLLLLVALLLIWWLA
jgi:hypothetical protein